MKLLCNNCGTISEPIKVTKGSFFIELLLWVCFIIPGLVYSLWRLTTRYKACPACKESGMIPLNSPKAKQILGVNNAI